MDHLTIDKDCPTSSGPYEPSTTSIGVHYHQSGHEQSQNVDGSNSNNDNNNEARSIKQRRPPEEPEINYSGLALVFLAPALGGFSYGFDIGATSFVLSMMLTEGENDKYWWHKLPKVQQGLMVSCLSLGALIGSHIVLVYLAKSIGRRKELRIAATLYIVGSMFNVMSGTILATSEVFIRNVNFGWGLVSLLIGRLLYGVGVAFSMHSAPTYISEMAPKQVRGAMVSAKETVIVFGIVVGMLLGDLQSDYPENWTGESINCVSRNLAVQFFVEFTHSL
jgi:MFS family permease